MIIGFVSDAHGCVEALDKALDILMRQGAQQIYHLGDSLGYIPGWAAADRLRDLGIPSLCGNHEQMLLKNAIQQDKDQILGLGLTRRMATHQQLQWASTLPSALSVEDSGPPILLVHGSPRDPVNEYIYPDTSLENLNPGRAVAVFMGHTHRPCIRNFQGVQFVNVGSCTLPRDQERLGCVCLWNTETRIARLERFCVGEEVRRAGERCIVHRTIFAKINALIDAPFTN